MVQPSPRSRPHSRRWSRPRRRSRPLRTGSVPLPAAARSRTTQPRQRVPKPMEKKGAVRARQCRVARPTGPVNRRMRELTRCSRRGPAPGVTGFNDMDQFRCRASVPGSRDATRATSFAAPRRTNGNAARLSARGGAPPSRVMRALQPSETLTLFTLTGVTGRSRPSVGVFSIFFTTSMPEVMRPNTGCFEGPGVNQSR